MNYYAIEVENPRGERFIERQKFRTRFMANIELADMMENSCDAGRIFIAEKDADETVNASYKKLRTSL